MCETKPVRQRRVIDEVTSVFWFDGDGCHFGTETRPEEVIRLFSGGVLATFCVANHRGYHTITAAAEKGGEPKDGHFR